MEESNQALVLDIWIIFVVKKRTQSDIKMTGTIPKVKVTPNNTCTGMEALFCKYAVMG
jgi:hypothetical protein